MMRSLFSGVSGLKVHQTKMDVIGNNISNVNTIGFKASSVTFADVFYQTTQSASGPNTSTGTTGKNAMQIGLGANVASIKADMTTQGATQRTDNPFDIMINGNSFFVVNAGSGNYFTKAGSFSIDKNGTLCTPAGASVMGWQVDPKDTTKTVATSVTPLQIMKPENLYADPAATTDVYISGNIDSKDTQIAANSSGKIVKFSFYDKMGHEYTANMKIIQSATETNTYKVSLTDIVDEDGQSIFVKKTTDSSGNVTYSDSSIKNITFGGTSYTVDVNTDTGVPNIEMSDPPELSFNAGTGKFVTVGSSTSSSTDTTNKSLKMYIGASSGASSNADAANPFSEIAIDFSSITMYSTSGSSSLEATKGSLTGTGIGKKVGNMTGVSIDTAGKIYGKYDNGDNRLLGQIAVASFSNPSGLEAVGNSMFSATQNSGDFDGVGHDVTKDGGSMTTGVLEMSNVDLSQQFTDMITTQRGFQANSRIITTSDSMLEELINLKR